MSELKFSGIFKHVLHSHHLVKSYTCCVSFIDIVLPSEAELLTFDSERTGRFYSTFTKAMEPSVLQHNGRIRKLVGEGLFSYFPQTNDFTNIDAIKDVLELQQIERRQSLSNEMAGEITPEISYRICADYETLDDWDGVFDPSHPRGLPFVYEICSRTPTNTVVVGQVLYEKINTLPQLNEEYTFERISEYVIGFKKDGVYLLHSVST